MHRLLPKLTYANVVATLALCLALGGSAAFAAGKIGSSQIATGGVHTKNLQERSVTSGKLALGAVHANQIAPRSVGADQIATGAVGPEQLGKGAVSSAAIGKGAVGQAQIADGAVGSAQIADGAVGPAQMQFPVTLVARPSGGQLSNLTFAAFQPYPLTAANWTQHAGAVDLLVGTVTAEVGPVDINRCEVVIEFGLGENFADGQLGTAILSNFNHGASQVVSAGVPALPILVDATGPVDLTARAREDGGCQPAATSTVLSTDLRIIELG
jgi:hypothetical protein